MSPQGGAPVVVSVTPVALDRDSRTLKQAASLARAGYRSIACEWTPSPGGTAAMAVERLAVVQAPAAASPPAAAGVSRLRSRVPGPIRAPVTAARGIWFFVRDYLVRTYRVLPAADLYVLHGFYQYPAVRLKAAIRRVPIVYDVHDFYSAGSSDRPLDAGERVVRAWHNWVERRCARHAERLITVSQGLAELLEDRFGRRAEVVRNVQDPRLDEEPARTLREASGVAGDVLLACFVGAAKDGLDLDPVLAAMRAVPSLHLALVGRGHDAAVEHARAFGVADRVHAVGPVPSRQVRPFIASADVAVFPYRPITVNYRVALPNGVFHALAAGLPILYSDLTEVTRLLEPAGAGVVLDLDAPSTIAATLRELADDRSALRALAEQAEALGRDLTWEREEQRFLRLVEEVLR